METNEKTLQDILNIVTFIRDNAALQSSVEKIESDVSTLKSDVSAIRVEMEQGFDSIHAELASIRNEIAEIKLTLKQTIETEKDDTRAIGGNYLNLLKRVVTMEEKIRILEKQRA